MAKIQFKQIQTEDRNLSLVQDNIEDIANRLQQGVFFGGVVLNNQANISVVPAPSNQSPFIALTSGQDNNIAHGLGRQVQYWLTFDKDTNTTVWRVEPTTDQERENEKSYMRLQCATTCNVILWVN